jgi:hypothetical protein
MNEGKKDRRDPIRTIKARNPVAKNATSAIGGGAAGAHKDKKKAMKQGDVKHKNQEYAESLQNKLDAILAEDAKFGVYYNEKLAQKVFDENPNLSTSGRADELLSAGFKIAVIDLGKKQAQGLFGYDEDFPSDFVSSYSYLQKQQGMSEAQQYNKFRVGQRATYKNSQGQELPVIVTAVDYDDEAVKFKSAGNKPFSNGELELEVDPGWKFLTPDRSYDPNSLVKATSRESRVGEEFNAEYDDEAGMADNNLETLKRAVDGIDDVINTGDNLPEWCQEKIAVAKSMLVTVWDYMLSDKDGETAVSEASALEKFRKAASEREKKHNDAEKEMNARHARGEEDMKGSIDRLEKHVNTKEGLRDPKDNPCWKGYKPVGTKKKGGKTVPNCVPKEGWTHDSLAAELFETENTYEDRLSNLLNKRLGK